LTAKQAMIYASKLKNSIKDNVNHEIIAKNLMKDLFINDIEDTNVENCSSGEQKRLVIAMELTSSFKPRLIFIDEPTSGLDSNAAEVVRIRYFILFIYL
jgi:ABC-type multidrug transport system ATPase subunit